MHFSNNIYRVANAYTHLISQPYIYYLKNYSDNNTK